MDRCRKSGIILIFITILTLTTCQPDETDQVQVPVGAYRIFPKTSFSCTDRPAGYYADVETGCQVYHMCDDLGRQFSYSCPNTTLFQQRMLICDHWYMVNCSRAESHYAANLLIGQRDKPFVPEEENQLRTPRPDLLDRPYAPDYSGESLRNQYKQFPSIHNQIIDYNSEKFNKPTATRWRIPRPSTEILPPAEPSPKVPFPQSRQPVNSREPSQSRQPLHSRQPLINRRNYEVEDTASVDLGTSYTSHYNSSADISAEKAINEKSAESNVIIPTIKTPSKLYEPPFLYPIWNENYTAKAEEQTEVPKTTSTPLTTLTTTTPSTTPPKIPSTVPSFRTLSTAAGRPFSPVFITSTTPFPSTTSTTFETIANTYRDEYSTSRGTTYQDHDYTKYTNQPTTGNQDRTESNRGTEETSTARATTTSNHIQQPDFELSVPREDQLSQPSPFSLRSKSDVPKPSVLLLPPFPELVTHDVATTQGPPIYYEWKTPSNALEPPKLDPPIGVDGRKEEDTPADINDSLSTASSFVDSTASNKPRPFSHNPFLSPIVNKSQRSVAPSQRSIQHSSTQTNSLLDNDTKDTNKTLVNERPTEADIDQLRKDWHVPDFLFPLESDARTGYEHTDTVNSFQIKIPERRSDKTRWYGENPDCPECHPTFVKPGTCEPCVRRR